jgi:hypothetical protein
MNNNLKSYTTTAIIAIALASMLMLAPNALAAKQTTSGVHFQGPAPTINCPTGSDTCTSTGFTLAGLGQGSGKAQLTVTGTFDVTCANPGSNEDVPGQRTTATGASQEFGFTAQNGKASVPSLTAKLDPNTVTFGPKTCPNAKWTPSVVEGSGTITSATLIVTFNGQEIYRQP